MGEVDGLPRDGRVPEPRRNQVPETRGRRLTKRSIDAAKPGPTRRVLWDKEVIGFGLSLLRTGSRSYVLKYRFRGQQRWFTIGRHGSPWTVEAARKEALRLLGEVARGVDPTATKQAARHGLDLSQLCSIYLAEGVGHKKLSTLKVDRGRIARHIVPLLGNRRVDAVARADVERMRDEVVRGKTAIAAAGACLPGSLPRGGAGAAAQTVALLSAIMSFAVERNLRTDNPCHGVKRAAARRMNRFLSETEIGGLALDEQQARGGNPFAAAAIRLLLLTGCRRAEILGLRWSEVDAERRCLRLGDSKTGAKIVYLNAPAVALLDHLPRVDGCPFVIAGSRGDHLQSLDKVWRAVRADAGLNDCRLHDLRHTLASLSVSSGASLPIISKLLGHATPAMTARYAHLADDPVREASEAVGERISAAMSAGTDERKVVELRRRS